MLCELCRSFLHDLLNQDFATWRRVPTEDIASNDYTLRFYNRDETEQSAEAGCRLCRLFCQVRHDRIANFSSLGDKWHTRAASIDVSTSSIRRTETVKRTTSGFDLLTIAPQMSRIPFETFALNHSDAIGSDQSIAVPIDPWSPQTLAVAASWLKRCVSYHPECKRATSAPLPTRVLDVDEMRLIITHDQSTYHGPYVTLSHCWGGGSRLMLTKDNLDVFTNGISVADLPKTFQDAVRMTKSLGARYLWIDALCIVQDDPGDWEREAAAMCRVFENAQFSISALTSIDSHSGILQERTTPSVTIEVDGHQFGVRPRLDSLNEALRRSKLETRAWCYQEHMLANAILHVAPHQIFWECKASVYSETDLSQLDQSLALGRQLTNLPWPNTPGDFDALSSVLLVEPTRKWTRMVEQYSARDLTRPGDRLTAIAGLAERMSGKNGTYICGIWAGEEHEGLLWSRSKRVQGHDNLRLPHTSARRPQDTIAPSWSWASINDKVAFHLLLTHPNTLSGHRVHKLTDAEFEPPQLSRTELTSSSARLRVSGLLKRGSCKLPTRNPVAFQPTSSQLADGRLTYPPSRAVFTGSQSAESGIICFLDYPEEPLSKTCYCLQITNWYTRDPDCDEPDSNQRPDTARSPRIIEVGSYLILERADTVTSTDYPVFKRIGMGYDDVDKVDKVLANAARQKLELV